MSESAKAPGQPRRIDLVDDDPQIRRLVERYLRTDGFQVRSFESAEAFWRSFQDAPCDVVLLDVMLPGEDGFSLATRLRQRSKVGIIMLTNKIDTVDRVVGLEVGADDYIAKPFELRELLARIRSLIRRLSESADVAQWPGAAASGGSAKNEFQGWQLDTETRTLTSPAGEEVPLTSKEFELLALLARHRNRPLSRDQILEQLDGRARHPYDRSIDVLIHQLRSKLEPGDEPPKILKTVRGVGYMLAASTDSS